jgi:hypothetical protein
MALRITDAQGGAIQRAFRLAEGEDYCTFPRLRNETPHVVSCFSIDQFVLTQFSKCTIDLIH